MFPRKILPLFIILTVTALTFANDFSASLFSKCSSSLQEDTTINIPKEFLEQSENSTCEDIKSFELNLSGNNWILNGSASDGHGEREFYWTAQGYFKAGRKYFGTKSYCISNATASRITVQTCVPNCNQDKNYACLKKCCPFGQVIGINWSEQGREVQCFKTKYDWVPHIYTHSQPNDSARHMFQKYEPQNSFYYEIRHSECQKRAFSQNQNAKPSPVLVRILQEGRVLTKISGNHNWGSPVHFSSRDKDDFCADGFYDVQNEKEYIPKEENQIVLVCQVPVPQRVRNVWMVFFILSHVSSLIALLTVIAHLLLWDKQNLHGWTLTTFSFCMFCKMTSVLVGYTVPIFEWIPAQTALCITVGVLKHFFDLSMFSWLNVICFDLWTTIRSAVSSEKRSKGYQKFILYNLFGFGVPTLIIIISLGIDFYTDELDDRIIRPQYGREKCALDHTSYGYYSVAPSMILYAAMLLFSVFVLRSLYHTTQDARVARCSSTNSKSLCALYLKLSIVTGIPWIFEFLAFFVNLHGWVPWTLNILNIMQTVGIFHIFVCKKNILMQLGEKYRLLKVLFQFLNVLRTKLNFASVLGCCGESSERVQRGSTSISMTSQITQISA
ncbi:unnamed protein product [Allacma fusca]|uniref:G-protein coupled receptors family 2 profile 2 domain-containing protein n=1 Tax=Allacma fusca TaxID=39272 RepID=A0A8J2JK72_9HEXA|nr:unnamed protein product [Allacma fusca]